MTLEEFKARLQSKVSENREAFEGTYKNQITELMGLSKSEIDDITPGTTDMEAYDQLITLVKEASRANLSQAELKQGIEDLGEVAIKIAGKVTSLGF
jgi:2-C-methyl-D-erythritol 4-phosphate cytidylyltransferase